jgi:hypothetical protein
MGVDGDAPALTLGLYDEAPSLTLGLWVGGVDARTASVMRMAS